ncbi:PilZ domain-containing protein [Alkalimarinus coralli]|uniref:PilZ domain-containing protein n=1 Tax=Alkalimarinus coralli TaxID=2935863 RepID=UPI00202B5B85|nr:PilZ domain-containing protein [Alkalimarinus coralli]
MKSSPEKRKHPRIKVSYDVEIVHPAKGWRRFQTRDISNTGIFIVGDTSWSALEKGQIVRVKIETADFFEPMNLDMRVVRHTVDGNGLSFV